MEFVKFEDAARKAWAEIPDKYKQGVDGLVVNRESHTHPEHDDFFTLGECITEAYPSDFGGPDTIRSAVVLYYGSFAALAEDDEEFDWGYEIKETIQHELQHHLEQLALEDRLEDFDYAVEQNYQRIEGEPFDPLFYRAGEHIDDRLYLVDTDVFHEISRSDTNGFECVLEWNDDRYRLNIPASDADILFAVLDIPMPDVQGEFAVVRVRERKGVDKLRAAFKRMSVEEVSINADKDQ